MTEKVLYKMKRESNRMEEIFLVSFADLKDTFAMGAKKRCHWKPSSVLSLFLLARSRTDVLRGGHPCNISEMFAKEVAMV